MRALVTRPEQDAQRWVRMLRQHGVDASALPLITIHPAPDIRPVRAAWQRMADWRAVMFVSAPAAQYFFAQRLPSDADFAAVGGPQAWATGPGTAAALGREGVDAAAIAAPPHDSAQFDSEALWAVVGHSVSPGDRVLIVRGGAGDSTAAADRDDALASMGHGRGWLAERLLHAGAQVEFVVAYWRGMPTFDAAQRERARAAASDGTVWLLTSTQAVANLAACMPQQSWSHARALTTHPRIAAAARAAGFGVVCESRPGISALVASIESIG